MLTQTWKVGIYWEAQDQTYLVVQYLVPNGFGVSC